MSLEWHSGSKSLLYRKSCCMPLFASQSMLPVTEGYQQGLQSWALEQLTVADGAGVSDGAQ